MEIPRHWRIRKQRYSMVGGVCPVCEAKMFPVREVCPNCGHGSQMLISLNDQVQLYVQPVSVQSVVNA